MGSIKDGEFADVYGPCRTTIVDPDVGVTIPLVDLLKRAYITKGEEKLLFSDSNWRPSLEARSDAELHDLDNPRWAKRVHVFIRTRTAKQYIGFVNMRALSVFTRRLSPAQKRYLKKGPHAGSHLICGAYLAPPPHLLDAGFQFPTAFDQGVYYNELSGWQGTVFASPMRIWGGVCSQACVYMATYSMVSCGCSVLGISDIALAAAAPQRYARTGEIEIRGLTLPKLRGVFASASLGLNSFWERVAFRTSAQRLDPYDLNDAAAAIASYLAQGFPVILSVHMGRLVQANAGQYSPALLAVVQQREQEGKTAYKDNLHSIVLVGFRPPDRTRPYFEFVYHDSLSGPYVPIAIASLARGAADSFQRDRIPFNFEFVVPVPSGVGVSLREDFGEYIGPGPDSSFDESLSRAQKKTALRGSSQYWKKEVYDYETGATPHAPWSSQGYFPLKCSVPESAFHLVSRRDFFDRYVSLNADNRWQALQTWQDLEEHLPRALWVEEFGQSLRPGNDRWTARRIHGYWAWSAEAPYPPDQRYQSPIFQCTQGTLSIDYRESQADIEMQRQGSLEIRKAEPLQVGAITSYVAGPIRKALEGLAYYKVPNVDLYLFQAEDLHKYYGVPGQSSPLRVVSGAKIRLARIANQIADDVRRARDQSRFPFMVRGIATYFPEISSLNPQKRQMAVAALQNIIRLAGLLQSPRYGYQEGLETRFVEIVAGTRVSGFHVEERQDPRAGASKPIVVAKATLASFYHKLYVLLQSLQVLAKTAHDHGVCLAIEVEPGLLPFISEFARVESLVKAIASDPGFVKTLERALHHPFPHIVHREHVGLNVDVAHMRLCGIRPEQLRKDPILNRLCHVHIGDIGPGHLCDLVTGSVSTFEGYREWFELFHDAANGLPRLGPYPDFSCCLSVELEACRDRKMIGAAYHRTQLLLRKYYEQRNRMFRNTPQAGSG